MPWPSPRITPALVSGAAVASASRRSRLQAALQKLSDRAQQLRSRSRRFEWVRGDRRRPCCGGRSNVDIGDRAYKAGRQRVLDRFAQRAPMLDECSLDLWVFTLFPPDDG